MFAVLLGPLRALGYVLSHGLATAVLGACWAVGLQWQWSILLMTGMKVACQAASLALASLTVGENLLSIAISTIGVYLDKAGLMLGTNATANITYNFLLGAFVCSLILNSAPLVYLWIYAANTGASEYLVLLQAC